MSGNPWDGNGGCMRNGFPEDCSWIARDVMFGDPRTLNDTCPSCGAGGGMFLDPSQIDRLERLDYFGNWLQQTNDTKKKKPTLKKPTKEEQRANRKRTMEDSREIDKNEGYITPFNFEGIREGIRVVWSNANCRQTVLGLLNAVASRGNPLVEGGDIEKLFDLLLKQPGGGLTRTKVPGSAGFSSVSGSFRNGDASVSAPTVLNYTPHEQLVADIQNTFNELMHLAGRNQVYTDRDFSYEIRDNPVWANSTNMGPSPLFEPQVFPLDNPKLTEEQRKILEKRAGDGPWSIYFHQVVKNACF